MEQIKHLEYLSKLNFTEDERRQFKDEFEKILSFVDEIKDIDLPQDLEKDRAISLSDLREDCPKSSMLQEEALSNAPRKKDGCYVTPLVVE